MTPPKDRPLDKRGFAALMERFAPFERAPHVAVACSGGSDSLALTILAAAWARDREGRVTALIVDHGLRGESAAEAAVTRRRLAQRGIRSVILNGNFVGPRRDVQNALRDLRYRLMQDWCAEKRVLHLLVAHHQQDQAETVLLRLARGSGVDGLAGMAWETPLKDVRILRPLLDVAQARLAATVRRTVGQHVDDPSNRDPAYARVRMRRFLPALSEEGLTPERLCATARRMGRARAALEHSVNQTLGGCVGVYPAGYCRIAPDALIEAPEEVALRVLSRVVACVSGAAYPPRLERLERLYAAICDRSAGRGRTLAGVRVAKWRDQLLAFRELAATAPPLRLTGSLLWDGRFACEDAVPGWTLGALGSVHAASIAKSGTAAETAPPRPIWPTLPAFRRRGQLTVVPHLGISTPGGRRSQPPNLVFLPGRPLGRAIFNFS